MTEPDAAVEDLLEQAEDMNDSQRLEAIAGLAERVNTNPMPDDHAARVIRWRSQARSAATFVGGEDDDDE